MEIRHLPLGPQPLPEPGEVVVWLLQQDLLPLDPLDPPGSGDSRREQLARQRLQQQFFLRLLLGACLGVPGKEIQLGRSDRGKPHLDGMHAGHALRFNASHSSGWLAVATSTGMEVGVDIEALRALPRARLLARRFLSAAEEQWLQTLEEPALSAAFLDQWTAREALVKAQGCGLAGALGEIELGWQPPVIRRLPAAWEKGRQMSLSRLDLPEDLVGHVAAGAEIRRLRVVHLQR